MHSTTWRDDYRRSPAMLLLPFGEASCWLDLDVFLRPLRLRSLGKDHREHPLVEVRLDFVGINAFGHTEAPLEGTEVTFVR